MDGRRRKTVHAARRPEERPKDASHSSTFTECTSAMLTLPSFAGPHVRAIGHANRAYEVFRRYRGSRRPVTTSGGASSGCFRHQLLLPRPYLVLTKPLRLDIQCQRGASVKIGWKYLDD